MNKPENYSRFFALLRQLDIPAHQRDSVIHSFTDGQKSSLSQLTVQEYASICRRLSARIDGESHEANLRKARSQALLQLQKMGIDTTSWQAVDHYVQHPRIAGKRFYCLSIGDLHNLLNKLRAIRQKEVMQQLGTLPIERRN